MCAQHISKCYHRRTKLQQTTIHELNVTVSSLWSLKSELAIGIKSEVVHHSRTWVTAFKVSCEVLELKATHLFEESQVFNLRLSGGGSGQPDKKHL